MPSSVSPLGSERNGIAPARCRRNRPAATRPPAPSRHPSGSAASAAARRPLVARRRSAAPAGLRRAVMAHGPLSLPRHGWLPRDHGDWCRSIASSAGTRARVVAAVPRMRSASSSAARSSGDSLPRERRNGRAGGKLRVGEVVVVAPALVGDDLAGLLERDRRVVVEPVGVCLVHQVAAG